MKFPEFLRVAVVPHAGLFDIKITEQNKIKIVGGAEKAFLEMLSEVLNFEYEVKIPNDKEWGNLKNGTWTGAIGMVHYNKADIAIGKISITEERKTVVDYSYPYDIEDLTFATKIPGFLPKTTAFITPFDIYTWCSILVLSFLFLATLSFCQGTRCSFQRYVLKVFGYLLMQPLDIPTTTVKIRWLVLTWLITARFIPLFYSVALLAFLTIPQEELSVKDIEELSEAIDKGTFKCKTFKGASYTNTLTHNRQEMVRIIANHIKENNYLIEPNKEEAINAMKDGRTAMIASRHFLTSQLHNIFVSDDLFFTLTRAVVLKKEFCCKKTLNTLISRIRAAGLYKKILEDDLFHLKVSNELLEASVNGDYFKSLELEDLSSAFILLLSGYCLSAIVWILEVLPMCLRIILHRYYS
ncbi:uncharacterized protein TNIN_168881 [Trichonephila inaurata madagascariensis]|uniref:Ionotropic glutamate receptor L-glutamate and glycine-binding domain-containing protein n=1 Tax=Trichonephila inaurata madagascariensis TaxID=2747483 RepID=A0A8X6XFS7_9ARAC|nr:uncharacterized protein TNIN_168881 [Trichonephila inaurata madagascariensis]